MPLTFWCPLSSMDHPPVKSVCTGMDDGGGNSSDDTSAAEANEWLSGEEKFDCYPYESSDDNDSKSTDEEDSWACPFPKPYKVACEDLRSLIKWNINDLDGPWPFPWDEEGRTLEKWQRLFEKFEALGRRPRHGDDENLINADRMISRVIKFPQLCRDLQRNNPKTTSIQTDGYKFPSGYAVMRWQ
jgi:hypothetical protein